MALVEIGRESGYATARSVVDSLLRELGWKAEYAAIEHPTFVQGRAAEFSVDGKPIGVLGEVHPEVLTELRAHVSGGAGGADAAARLLRFSRIFSRRDAETQSLDLVALAPPDSA